MRVSVVSHDLRFELGVPSHTYLHVVVILASALYIEVLAVYQTYEDLSKKEES